MTSLVYRQEQETLPRMFEEQETNIDKDIDSEASLGEDHIDLNSDSEQDITDEHIHRRQSRIPDLTGKAEA